MFAIYTLFEKPDMFNSYIAVSPYLQFADQAVLNRVESILSERKKFNKHLHITLGNEPAYTASLNRIEILLSEKTKGLTWKISKHENEDHVSVPLKSLYDGLEFIYSDWRLKNKTIEEGLEAIKIHYSNVGEKYGFGINPAESVINVLGYRYLGNENYENAIDVFKYNVELYPKSANVYDSLGDALEKDGRHQEAFENYKMAVEIGTSNNDRNLKIYKQNLDRLDSTNKAN